MKEMYFIWIPTALLFILALVKSFQLMDSYRLLCILVAKSESRENDLEDRSQTNEAGSNSFQTEVFFKVLGGRYANSMSQEVRDSARCTRRLAWSAYGLLLLAIFSIPVVNKLFS
jgi:hypothetical protein